MTSGDVNGESIHSLIFLGNKLCPAVVAQMIGSEGTSVKPSRARATERRPRNAWATIMIQLSSSLHTFGWRPSISRESVPRPATLKADFEG